MAGRKISDHGGWPSTSDSMMKSKTHTKEYHSAEGSGAVHNYADTSELIKKDQEHADSKAKSHPMKPGYRY